MNPIGKNSFCLSRIVFLFLRHADSIRPVTRFFQACIYTSYIGHMNHFTLLMHDFLPIEIQVIIVRRQSPRIVAFLILSGCYWKNGYIGWTVSGKRSVLEAVALNLLSKCSNAHFFSCFYSIDSSKTIWAVHHHVLQYLPLVSWKVFRIPTTEACDIYFTQVRYTFYRSTLPRNLLTPMQSLPLGGKNGKQSSAR